MDFNDMSNNDDGFNDARRIIAEAQRFRPLGTCCAPKNNNGVTGPTGPTGPAGATDTYDYFFYKINRNYSSLFLMNT